MVQNRIGRRFCLVSHRALSLVPCCFLCTLMISQDIDSEIRLFADDCVDANNKETDKKDPCFIYSRGNGPRKCRKHQVS